MKKAELRKLVLQAARQQAARHQALLGDDNPQVVATRNQCHTSCEVLKAVADAIDAPRPLAAYSLQILAS